MHDFFYSCSVYPELFEMVRDCFVQLITLKWLHETLYNSNERCILTYA